jgi:ribonucleotide reductase alpha subunit
MEAVRIDAPYDLVNPRTGQVVGCENAREIFDLIVQGAWKTGEPGVFFIDRANFYNPVPPLGEYEATNPCVTGDTRVLTPGGIWRRIDQMMLDQGGHSSVEHDHRGFLHWAPTGLTVVPYTRWHWDETTEIEEDVEVPAGHRIGHVAAVALIAYGVVVMFMPEALPGTMA